MERRIVIPGELIGESGQKVGDGVYREGDRLYASILGLLDAQKDFVRVIPLAGKYMPKVDDFVIGTIVDSQLSSWSVDINSAYNGILNASDYYRDIDPFQTDINKIMTPGELIYAQVREITHSKKVYITMAERGARALKDGRIIDVMPPKIPRVIGKKSSMITMIKKESNCNILVGQNGKVWIDGKPPMVDIVVKAIRKIEAEAHKAGLTDSVRDMIIKERESL